MKLFKKVIFILIVIVSILEIKSFASTGKINIEATRLRKENNTTSDVLTNIYKGEVVEIVEEKGEWVKIKYDDYTGFIKKEFVDIKETTKTEKNDNKTEKDEDKKETVSNYENTDKKEESSLEINQVKVIEETYIRVIPNFMSKVIHKAEKDSIFTLKTQMNKWVQVTDGTITGWILKNKLDIGADTQIDETSNEKQEESKAENTIKENKVSSNKVENKVENKVANNTESNKVTNNTTTQSSTTKVSKKGKVNVETANIREKPTTSSKRIEFLDEGDVVTITEETDEWYKIEYGNLKGYVSKELITLINEKEQISSRSLEEERKAETNKNDEEKNEIKSTGNEVVEFAKKFLGYSYVLGGKNPESGFDCSGFTQYIYKNFGYSLSSVSYNQVNVGREVPREDLKPGDLILFNNEEKTKIGHTGIYIGEGNFIHAANPKRGVVCDNLNTLSYYNERYVTARRIVE